MGLWVNSAQIRNWKFSILTIKRMVSIQMNMHNLDFYCLVNILYPISPKGCPSVSVSHIYKTEIDNRTIITKNRGFSRKVFLLFDGTQKFTTYYSKRHNLMICYTIKRIEPGFVLDIFTVL